MIPRNGSDVPIRQTVLRPPQTARALCAFPAKFFAPVLPACLEPPASFKLVAIFSLAVRFFGEVCDAYTIVARQIAVRFSNELGATFPAF